MRPLHYVSSRGGVLPMKREVPLGNLRTILSTCGIAKVVGDCFALSRGLAMTTFSVIARRRSSDEVHSPLGESPHDNEYPLVSAISQDVEHLLRPFTGTRDDIADSQPLEAVFFPCLC